MSEVVQFPRPVAAPAPKEPLYLRCRCGCMSFMLCEDGTIECASCEHKTDAGAHWMPRNVQPAPVPAGVQSFNSHRGMGPEFVLAYAKNAKFVLASDGRGTIRAWADADAGASDEWVRRILSQAEAMYPLPRSDDDEVQSEPDEGQG